MADSDTVDDESITFSYGLLRSCGEEYVLGAQVGIQEAADVILEFTFCV